VLDLPLGGFAKIEPVFDAGFFAVPVEPDVFEAAFDPTAQANIGRRETGINRLVPAF
jgi:hypothetical protein